MAGHAYIISEWSAHPKCIVGRESKKGEEGRERKGWRGREVHTAAALRGWARATLPHPTFVYIGTKLTIALQPCD